MKLTIEVTKNKIGDGEVYLLKIAETKKENILKSASGIGQWIIDQFDQDKPKGDVQ